MAKKGYIVVEGAKAFCSSSVANNSKGTAVPMEVKSQKKKLGKNKYFAQEKPIATYLDDKADSFGGGNGFGNCKGPDGKPYPCKAKCNIKYKDYYENVDFNKSMKILLDVSTGTCPGYGIPGTIQFATTGQSNNASQIDVKEADEFSVANASPQWETKDPTDKTKVSVSSISMISPIPITELKDTYYYIQQANSWSPFTSFNILTPKLTLKANFKGEVTKIIWTLFKGEGVKDKVKTFIGLGGQFNQDLDSTFKNLEEGKYKIEAYGGKPGDAKCTLNVEVVKDFVKKITIPASSIISIPVPVSLERKVGSPLEQSRILNKSIQTSVIPSAYWRIKEGNNILHNTFAGTTSPNIVSVISSPSGILVTFKNKGKYTIEAFTNPNEIKPETATIEIKSTLGIETIDHGSSLLRYNDNFSVWVKGFNAIYIPDGAFKTVNWYLKKEGTGRLRALENSSSFKVLKINKRIDEFLFRDAGIINGNYFGKYSIEAYANPLGVGKEPQFSGGDCFNFEVIRNSIDQLALPSTKVPQGTKVKYTATARISPLISGETIRIEVPQGVTNNGDGTLTFTELGEFTISAHMEGQYTDPKVTETKIKVAQPKLKRALWAYGTGVKRTETGYEEETYGFLEIDGLQNQALKVKIWVKGETDGFYQEPAKYMLEEKPLTLNSEGKASFQIITNTTYKEKIEKAIPKTTDNPNPQYKLVFTIEPQIASTADIVFPSSFSIEGTKSVTIQGGTTLLEVLESNEELTLTTEQKIVSIMFSTEDGKDIQRTQTFYGKTHKLWVHTVNMQEETLKVDLLANVKPKEMTDKDGIFLCLKSVKDFTEEKVGKDGLLELSVEFTDDIKNKIEENKFHYIEAQISKKIENGFVFLRDQLNIMPGVFEVVKSVDLKEVGIKAKKADNSPFTEDEKLALRKKAISYDCTSLKILPKGETPESIDNETCPVMVDEMAEIEQRKPCECNDVKMVWGTKVSCQFRKKVVNIAKELWSGDWRNMAHNLMTVMAFETNKSFNPAIQNKYGFTGLIQFGVDAAKDVDTTTDKLKTMTELEQLNYVKAYFSQSIFSGKIKTITDMYLAVNYPTMIKTDRNKPNDILYSAPKEAYYRNPALMYEEKNGKKERDNRPFGEKVEKYGFSEGNTYVWEVTAAMNEWKAKGADFMFKLNKKEVNINLSSTSVVVTDAGHGIGGDSGAQGNELTESEMALQMETQTSKYLTSFGIKNVRTRTKALTSSEVNGTEQVSYRVKVFKDNKAKVFVSHHFNSVGSTNNILLMYHPKTLRDKDGNTSSGASEKYFDNSQKLLEFLKTELGKVFNDGRKIVPYAAIYPNYRARSVGVLRDTDGSENASILIEHGEISNENVKFCKENSEAIGKAIATAIANYLGASKQDNGFYSECEDATSNSEAVTITEGSCQMCKSDHYNIAKSEHWLHQEPGECWAASVKVLKNYGISGGSSANRIIMANQTDTILTPTNTKEALDYIDSQLKINKPVVVGLDDNLRKTTYNSHKATDHFFVVVGKGCDNGKIYYRFFDVGAHTRESGTNESSKLHLQDNLLQGKSVGGTHNYTVTEVRRNN